MSFEFPFPSGRGRICVVVWAIGGWVADDGCSSRKLSAKNAKVVRPTLYNYIYSREEYEKYADELFRLMIEEKFDVRIHKTYPLKDAAQAHVVSKYIHALFFIVDEMDC